MHRGSSIYLFFLFSSHSSSYPFLDTCCSFFLSFSVILTPLYSVSRLAGAQATFGWDSEALKPVGVLFIWAIKKQEKTLLIAKIVLL